MKLLHLYTLFALSTFTAADKFSDEYFDENEFAARSPGACYCCTGYVAPKIAGTRCGAGERKCDDIDFSH